MSVGSEGGRDSVHIQEAARTYSAKNPGAARQEARGREGERDREEETSFLQKVQTNPAHG
jgi:hypothetical protein